MERHTEQLDIDGTSAVIVDGALPADLDLQLLISLTYGARARLQDLQRIADRELPNRLQRIGEANRFIRRVDERVFAISQIDPVNGWAIFDEIRASHDGSVQRLSQELRTRLPDRTAIS